MTRTPLPRSRVTLVAALVLLTLASHAGAQDVPPETTVAFKNAKATVPCSWTVGAMRHSSTAVQCIE